MGRLSTAHAQLQRILRLLRMPPKAALDKELTLKAAKARRFLRCREDRR